MHLVTSPAVSLRVSRAEAGNASPSATCPWPSVASPRTRGGSALLTPLADLSS